jgi:hypothetical protein
MMSTTLIKQLLELESLLCLWKIRKLSESDKINIILSIKLIPFCYEV